MVRFPQVGALNFRDMGGYPAADGRRIRWNVLYRSGTTHTMTVADLQNLAHYGIVFSYDLRSNRERQEHPSPLSQIPRIAYRFLDHNAVSGDVGKLLTSIDAKPSQAKGLMVTAYRNMPFEFRQAYRAIFAQLAAGNVPLVFNCAMGKDRTGVAAALILATLGVPYEVIVEDYLLSEQRFEESCRIMRDGEYAAIFTEMNRALWEPLMRVDADYLAAALDAIGASFGSVQRYIAAELTISTEGLERIRSNILV